MSGLADEMSGGGARETSNCQIRFSQPATEREMGIDNGLRSKIGDSQAMRWDDGSSSTRADDQKFQNDGDVEGRGRRRNGKWESRERCVRRPDYG